MSTEAVDVMQEAQVASVPAMPPKEAPAPAPLAVMKDGAPKVGIAPPSFAMPRTIADIQTIGKMMVASGFFKDVKTEAQACVKIIAGSALGYDPFTSLNAFHIIEGKVTPTAAEIGARVKRSGKYNYRVKVLDDSLCTLVFMERDGGKWMDLGESTFTKQDAIVAGIAGKGVWKSYFRNMVFSRALTNGVRWYCPDLFGGAVYTPEELGAEVDIIEGEMVVVSDAKPPVGELERKALSGTDMKALYEDARKVDPSLPPSLRQYAKSMLPEYDPTQPPTPVQAMAVEDRLRDLLANGAPVQQSAEVQPAPAPENLASEAVEGVVQDLHEYASHVFGDAEPQRGAEAPAEPAQGSLLESPATEVPPQPADAPAAQETALAPYPPAPPNAGPPMSPGTRGSLFAYLGQLGIKGKIDGVTEDGKAVAYDAKHVWMQGFGLTVPRDESGKETFSALCEPLAAWLRDRAREQKQQADRAAAEAKAASIDVDAECPACGFEGGAHKDDCPEGNPPQ